MKSKLILLSVFLLPCYFGVSQNASGTYNTDFNEMTIAQNGSKVTGTYKHQNGRVEGTLSGHSLTGFWFQSNGKGKLIFEFNADFTAFTGKWSYNDATPSSKWNGTRIAGPEKKSQPAQASQQVSKPLTQKTATAATASESSDTKDNLNNAADATGRELQKQNSALAKSTGNEAESNSTSANSIRKPLSEYEKSLVKEAKSTLKKAISEENITEAERTSMVQQSAKTLKEYGQPAAFPNGDISLKTNREKEYKRIKEEVVSANDLRKLLSEAQLAEKMSLINSMQIEILEEQIKILIPGKAPFDLSKDLVGTVFNISITEGMSGGQQQGAKDLVQKFRDLATGNKLIASAETLYLQQRDLMTKADLNIKKAEKLQAQLRKSYQDAENSTFTFREYNPAGASSAPTTSTSTAPKAQGKGLWVLVKTIDYDGKADLDNTNKNGVYHVNGNGSGGAFIYNWKYLGKADSYYNPPLLSDENSTIKCNVSAPPKVMDAGEIITLTLSMSFAAQKLSYFTSGATVSADFDKPDVAPGFASGSNISFVNTAGKSSFKINTHKSIKLYSVDEIVTATAPSGAKNMRIALRISFNPGAKMGTCYIYEWKYAY